MEYKNYITCFAYRSKKVLEKFSACDATNELNVTALLSVAASAFVIPFERLKKDHPFGDGAAFSEIGTKVKGVLEINFGDSDFFESAKFKIKLLSKEQLLKKEFDNSFEDIYLKDKKVQFIIDIIRNAFAHGNIYSCSKLGPNHHIDTLYFVSKNNNDKDAFYSALDEYKASEATSKTQKCKIYNAYIKNRQSIKTLNAVECSVEDFRTFLYKWIDLLSSASETPKENC
ncbi:MAG: hypothetical protein PHV10_01125 [Sulfuricurvum sp.]|nr:hypothetical protein [Sulfuricurvum sp.]